MTLQAHFQDQNLDHGGLTWEVALWDFGDVEEEGGAGDQVHDDDARQEQLHKGGGVYGLDIAQV